MFSNDCVDSAKGNEHVEAAPYITPFFFRLELLDHPIQTQNPGDWEKTVWLLNIDMKRFVSGKLCTWIFKEDLNQRVL